MDSFNEWSALSRTDVSSIICKVPVASLDQVEVGVFHYMISGTALNEVRIQ